MGFAEGQGAGEGESKALVGFDEVDLVTGRRSGEITGHRGLGTTGDRFPGDALASNAGPGPGEVVDTVKQIIGAVGKQAGGGVDPSRGKAAGG